MRGNADNITGNVDVIQLDENLTSVICSCLCSLSSCKSPQGLHKLLILMISERLEDAWQANRDFVYLSPHAHGHQFVIKSWKETI
jgi:hypothetical protein